MSSRAEAVTVELKTAWRVNHDPDFELGMARRLWRSSDGKAERWEVTVSKWLFLPFLGPLLTNAVRHELTHTVGGKHHPPSHRCGMVAEGGTLLGVTHGDHYRASKDEAKQLVRYRRVTLLRPAGLADDATEGAQGEE